MKIKKQIAIFVMAIIAILMINTQVQATQIKVTTDTLRLREEPNTTSSIVALLSIGDEYTVLEEDGNWYKIQAGDNVGYVSKDFVEVVGEEQTTTTNTTTPEEPEETEEPEVQEPTETTQTEQTVTGEKLVYIQTDLRSLPLFGSVSLEELRANSKVTVITQNNKWAYVQTDTQSGWMLADCLRGTETEEETTTAQPTSEPTTSQDDETQTEQETKTGYINSENVNFRQNASTTSSVIRRLPINTEVTILSEQDNWCRVEISGVTGYVSKDYVSDSRVETTSRFSEVERQNETTVEETVQTEEIEEIAEEVVEEETVATSNKGSEIVLLAKTFLGNTYVYAAEGPKNFDCSGFTRYIYKQYGVDLPHSAATQIKKGTAVEKSQLQAGDAVFFQDQAKTKVGHVGIYMGDGNFIHSSSAAGEVTITPMSKSYYDTRFVGARRYI